VIRQQEHLYTLFQARKLPWSTGFTSMPGVSCFLILQIFPLKHENIWWGAESSRIMTSSLLCYFHLLHSVWWRHWSRINGMIWSEGFMVHSFDPSRVYTSKSFISPFTRHLCCFLPRPCHPTTYTLASMFHLTFVCISSGPFETAQCEGVTIRLPWTK
jgi:hypothetical protein